MVTSTPCVLIVDDDEHVSAALARVLSNRGMCAEVAADAEHGLRALATPDRFDVVLADVQLPDVEGLAFLRSVRDVAPTLPVVVMSGAGTIDMALEAIRLGAKDFLQKPIAVDRLVVTLENAMRFAGLERRNRELEADQARAPGELLGSSPAMQSLRRLVAKVAPSDGRVLILGENGTGKELVAAAIHRASPRRDGPFVKLNCAAVPADLVESELFGHERGSFTGAVGSRRGRFEQADGGTLFLDEIGDMPPAMQAKLLRVLQEGSFERVGGSRTLHVDVRVLAATHRDLGALVDAGGFREDLFYRLAVVTIDVPPLRDRADDVPELAMRFLRQCARPELPLELSAGALEALSQHDWPGNVRELRNVVERLAILAEEPRIEAAAVIAQLRTARRARREPAAVESSRGPDYRPGALLEELQQESERRIVRAALAHHHGNKAATARALGVDRSHFHKKLKALGLDEPTGANE